MIDPLACAIAVARSCPDLDRELGWRIVGSPPGLPRTGPDGVAVPNPLPSSLVLEIAGPDPADPGQVQVRFVGRMYAPEGYQALALYRALWDWCYGRGQWWEGEPWPIPRRVGPYLVHWVELDNARAYAEPDGQPVTAFTLALRADAFDGQ